jgi:hypothetical protein
VGAGRFEVSDLIDALVRVQADQREAERRSLARAGQPGAARPVGNHQEWVAEEDRSWPVSGPGSDGALQPFGHLPRVVHRAAAGQGRQDEPHRGW